MNYTNQERNALKSPYLALFKKIGGIALNSPLSASLHGVACSFTRLFFHFSLSPALYLHHLART